MKATETKLEGALIIEPDVFNDERGYFFESFSKNKFEALGLEYDFVQDNESWSKAGTLRGLHFQTGDFAQAKLVRVISGCIMDVAVDLRACSPTFGEHVMVKLDGTTKKQLLIPRGFAHGFLALTDVIFSYKCDNKYSPGHQAALRYNDGELKINWPETAGLTISAKDISAPSFAEVKEMLKKGLPS